MMNNGQITPNSVTHPSCWAKGHGTYPSSHGPYFHPFIVQNEFDLSGTRSVRNKTHNIYVIVVELDK